MVKKEFFKFFGAIILSTLALSSQSPAAEEINLKNDFRLEQSAENLKNSSLEYAVETNKDTVSWPTTTATSNDLISLEQSSAPNIKIDLGVKKDNAILGSDEIQLDSNNTENGPTFIQRITKEEYRPGPLQLFNKHGYEFEGGPIKNVKVGLYYLGTETMFWPYNDSISSKWKDGAAEVTIITKFRDNKTGTRVVYNFLRNLPGHPNDFMEKFTELGVTHEFNKNNQIHIGQTWRLPIGVEGYQSTFNQDLPTKAQIGRTFSDTRSFGVRNIGTYKYMDYDIGLYDSTRYWRNFGEGMDLTTWVTFKPLANLDEKKFGKLTLGTGVATGKNKSSYTTCGAYLGYDYKRFHNKFEYAHANGYNAGSVSRNKAEGFYNTVIFDITKSLKLIGRYDFLNPDIAKNSTTSEYTGGLSYTFKSNIKVVGAYTYKNVTNGKHSNILSIQTQVRL